MNMYILYKKYELRDIMFGRVYLHANLQFYFLFENCMYKKQINNTQHIY